MIPSGVNPYSRTWPYVLAFAVEMERKLAENAHKDKHHPDCQDEYDGACAEGIGEPGWLSWFPPGDCMQLIYEEVNELRDVTFSVKDDTPEKRQAVTDEAADVANMSMMLACISGTLTPLTECTMSKMTRTYVLHGDDQSPRAYLEALIDVLEQQRGEVGSMLLRDARTQRQTSYERGRVDALDQTLDTVRDILDGIPTE